MAILEERGRRWWNHLEEFVSCGVVLPILIIFGAKFKGIDCGQGREGSP